MKWVFDDAMYIQTSQHFLSLPVPRFPFREFLGGVMSTTCRKKCRPYEINDNGRVICKDEKKWEGVNYLWG